MWAQLGNGGPLRGNTDVSHISIPIPTTIRHHSIFRFRICWPFDADQPANAAHVTVMHDVGYELFEVRCGHGLRPIRRLNDWMPTGTIDAVRREAADVFMKARGADGERKREKARALGKALASGWNEGGEHWLELEKIARLLG